MRADLALVGFGTVGQRFVRLLHDRREQLQQDCDLECRIVAIATRRHGAACCGAGLDGAAASARVESGGSLHELHDAQSGHIPSSPIECIERLAASEAPLRVVVETTTLSMAAGGPATRHVEAALEAGCHVVTANKGPVAFAYRRLAHLAERRALSFLFEGAVMDGIPVFNLVREAMPALTVNGYRGVINTTTQEILSALEGGEEFGPALARMQAAGIAEADPSLDIEGWDAAAKAAALANVLLDADITPHEVLRTGIEGISGETVRAAFTRGKRLRLVASARRGERPVVRPTELPAEDLLAGLGRTANALVLETDVLGELAICQLGGNPTQTAYALVSDLVTIRRRHPARPATRVHRSL
jgi:homoserine dehydrogenase